MKTFPIKAVCAVLAAATFSSCVNSYDAYGRPVQTVDPGAATAGVIAAGALGYAVGHNNSDRRVYYGGPYYRRPYYGHRHYHY